MTIAIVTDSTCDLPAKIIEDLGITVVPVFINIGDRGYLDGIDITRRDFYINLPNYKTHPTTGTPGMDAFLKAYHDLHRKGFTEILSIHISGSLSAVAEVARSAVGEFTQIPVTVRDSGQLSLGTGFQVEAAARMAAEGRTMREILHALNDLLSRTFVAARLDTLEYLRRSGRMNSLIAGIGSMLQLKPILTMKNGQAGSERVRTTVRAEGRLIHMLREHLPVERFALLHTHAYEEAERFCAKVNHLISIENVLSVDVTPVLGVHLGPGAVGYALVSTVPLAKNEHHRS